MVVALLTIGACDNPVSGFRSDLPLEGAAYFPVSAGNSWIYAVLDQNGQTIGSDTVLVTDIQGTTARLHEPGVDDAVYHVTENAVTLVEYAGADGMTDSTRHLLQTPLSMGSQWQSYFEAYEIIAVNSSINTRSGVFDDVIVVEAKTCAGYGDFDCGLPHRMRSYFARGVGPVKYEIWYFGRSKPLPSKTRSLVAYSQ